LILPTFFDERTRLARQIIADLCDIYGEQVVAPIHNAVILKDCAADGKTIWEADGNSRAAKEYAHLVYRVMEVL
jgi:cellulose biosynthesis protein BcsQ